MSNNTIDFERLVCKLLGAFGVHSIIIHVSPRYMYIIQCNLADYPDLVYPEPRLSRLAGDQKLHYHACAEGMANDLLYLFMGVVIG